MHLVYQFESSTYATKASAWGADFMSKRIWGVTATESFPAHVQIEDLLNAEDLGAPGVDEHAMQVRYVDMS